MFGIAEKNNCYHVWYGSNLVMYEIKQKAKQSNHSEKKIQKQNEEMILSCV
jgi:hypothetical protein